jgi:hypothetical protein
MKLFHALFLFVKEMWLRDRTFRQFVRENLSFILVSIGFTVMTVLFVNLYIIVKDQESQLAVSEQRFNHTNQQLTDASVRFKEQQDSIDWWRDKYLDLKDKQDKPPVQPVAQRTPDPGKPKPDPVPTTRPPSAAFVERWKRLNQ